MDIINIHSNLYDYSVEFVEDFSDELKKFEESTTYVIDANVYNLYNDRFKNLDKERIYLMDAVEHKKNMDSVMDILAFMQRIGVRKNWKVVCFGGGITQDVTTIAANLYLRNVDWYFFPTTLLSMCDSCIGGKSGINFNNFKNQIGVFYPPKKIFIDTRFIDTLTRDDYINGWGELLKFSLTADEKFYNDVENEKEYIPCKNIAAYIHRGLFTKKVIIEQDEFESDLRRLLNYGHTFGHALEAYTDNVIPHGKGVIWGIDVANYLAVQYGVLPKETYMRIKTLIKRAFLKEEIVVNEPEQLFSIIKTDKKVRGNIINFALLNKISNLMIHPVVIDEQLVKLFKDYLCETHKYYVS